MQLAKPTSRLCCLPRLGREGFSRGALTIGLSEEALWKEAVAAVQEEVADLSAKQKDLEKSLQTSATSSDLEAGRPQRSQRPHCRSEAHATRLEALRDLQKAADEQLSQVRLEISEVWDVDVETFIGSCISVGVRAAPQELAEIQRFALQTYEDGASSMTSCDLRRWESAFWILAVTG